MRPIDGKFHVQVPAKWVLAGEHSVLRGRRAIAFPHSEFSLSLDYHQKGNGLYFTDAEYENQIKKLLNRAHAWLKEKNFIPHDSHFEINGQLEIRTSIPVKSGLGSSAALCVALARFSFWKFAGESETRENTIALATFLENEFHGKSSGMDVHAVFYNQPVVFSMSEASLPMLLGVLPKFELIDTGIRGSTHECIAKVQHWCEQNPSKKDEVDTMMAEATERAVEALAQFHLHPVNAEKALTLAMNQAQACFEIWGLVPDILLKQKEEILKKGALAVKLTGAGMGGYWIALYRS